MPKLCKKGGRHAATRSAPFFMNTAGRPGSAGQHSGGIAKELMRTGIESQPEKARPAGQHLALLRHTNVAAKPWPQGGGTRLKPGRWPGVALRRAKLDAPRARWPGGLAVGQVRSTKANSRARMGIRCACACLTSLRNFKTIVWPLLRLIFLLFFQ